MLIIKILILCSHAGPIWLDDVNCYYADRFEDCTHRGWGVHNCGAYENIGLVCNPGTSGMVMYTYVSCEN